MTRSTPKIEILKKGTLIKAFPLGVTRLVVGSGPQANVRLRAAGIRPEHLAIELVDRSYLQAVNLAGDPKLLCDGAPFEAHRLNNGSEVQLGEVVFRLRLEPVAEPLAKPLAEPLAKPLAEPLAKPLAEPLAKPASPSRNDVGTDTAESFPVPPQKRAPRHSPPPPMSEEDAPTPKAQPAVKTVEPRGPVPRPLPAQKAGLALGEDTELSLEQDDSTAEAKAAEQRAVGTNTVPMLDDEAAPWSKDVAPAAPPPAPPRASPATPHPMPFLMIHPPGARRKRVKLPVGTFDLGSRGCAISLHFAGVAERHAVLTTHADGTMTIEDAGSGLPTILNGRVIRRAQFRLEDTLQVGRVSFTLEAMPAAKPTAAPTPPESAVARPPAAPADAPAEAPRSQFQAEASAKWVEAALRKRESGDDEDDSLPGVPVSKAAPAGTVTDPVTPPPVEKAPPTAPPPKPTIVQAPTPPPAVESPATPPAATRPRPAPPTPPTPAKGRAAPVPTRKKAPQPPAKVRKGPPPSASRPAPRKRPAVAEMPSEYKWQKRRRAALWVLLFLMLITAGGAYGGWRIYVDRTNRHAGPASQPRSYSWGEDGSGDESEYTWAGLVGATETGEEEDDEGRSSRSSRRHRSRRSSGDGDSESAIASADGSWSGVDDKAPKEEEEEDPEERMLKDLMNESMDILDEEFESKKKAWIDMDAVEATLQTVSSTARVCYKRALEDEPDLAGTMSLRITIGTRGKIESISLDPMSTLANSEMQSCVERQVRSKSYPAARGGPVTFTYPFRFSDR